MSRSNFTEAYRNSILILVEARRAQGITQVVLAGRLGKPQSFVAKYEGLERRLDVIEFIAVSDALDLARSKTLGDLVHILPKHISI